MLRSVARMVGAASVAALCLGSGSARAQDSVLVEMYGAGVHNFYAGNYSQAIADLTGAVEGNSKDPRVFYFRAMAELRLGQKPAAEADMRRGAALESSDVNQFYPVGRSLERVQGSSRLMLERYRSKARAEALVKAEKRNAARYEQRTRSEKDVLRQPPAPGPAVPVPPTAPPVAPQPAAPADVAAEGEDLFSDAAAKDTEEMPAKSPAAAALDADDPFAEAGAAKTPAAKPAAEEDPFAAGANDKDSAMAPDDTDSGMAPDDAVDEKMTDEADATEMPAAAEKPAKKAPAKPAAEDDDPFAAGADDKDAMADEDEKPAKKPAKKAAAADDEEDPMAAEEDEKPAKKPAKKAAAADEDEAADMTSDDEKPAMIGTGGKEDDNFMSDEDEKPAKKKKKPADDDGAMNKKVPAGGARASKPLDTSDPFVDDPVQPSDMNAVRSTAKKF